MAIMKKSFHAQNENRPLPSELVEVRGYDKEANEIDAIRLSTGEAVRVGFLPRDKVTNRARPEVKHFTGDIKKPRDMTAPAGSILLLDRLVEQKDDNGGLKLMAAWATALVRKPEEENIIKGNASITFLAEKQGVREDGTKGYKGLLTMIGDDRFMAVNGSKLGGSHPVLQGEKPVLAASLDEAKSAAEAMLAKGLNAGVRVRAGDDTASHCIYAKFQAEPAKLAAEFFNEIEPEIAQKIGSKDVACEVIPVVSLQIGSDTAGTLFTGMTSDGKESKSAAAIRQRFQGTVETRTGEERKVPAFTDAIALLRVRHAQNGEPYFSVENLHPYWSKEPPLGINNAILRAHTENSAEFVVSAKQNAESTAKNEAAAPAPAPEKRESAAVAAHSAAQSTKAARAEPTPAEDAGFGDFLDDDNDRGFTFGDNEGELSENDLRRAFGDFDDAPTAPAATRSPGMRR